MNDDHPKGQAGPAEEGAAQPEQVPDRQGWAALHPLTTELISCMVAWKGRLSLYLRWGFVW